MQPKPMAEHAPDMAFHVVDAMRRMGVAGLPRNYEIFYEAHSGSNAELRKALSQLGPRPTQADLDQIAHAFFTQNVREVIVENAHGAILSRIDEVLNLLRREHTSIERYGSILDESSAGLKGNHQLNADLLRKIVGIMSLATETTIAHGRQIVMSISDTSAELQDAKQKLVEYKRLAETDPLTQIANRRSFDRALADIYSSNKGIIFSALIIADIDRFKSINDRFGHPFGDRVLQHIAHLFRSAVPGGTLVARTGGEEFAVVVYGLTADAVYALADDLRTAVERTTFYHPEPGFPERVTVSLGVCMATDADSPDQLYERTDQALYASKLGGRNKVTRYPVPGPVRGRKNWALYRSE